MDERLGKGREWVHEQWVVGRAREWLNFILNQGWLKRAVWVQMNGWYMGSVGVYEALAGLFKTVPNQWVVWGVGVVPFSTLRNPGFPIG